MNNYVYGTVICSCLLGLLALSNRQQDVLIIGTLLEKREIFCPSSKIRIIMKGDRRYIWSDMLFIMAAISPVIYILSHDNKTSKLLSVFVGLVALTVAGGLRWFAMMTTIQEVLRKADKQETSVLPGRPRAK